MPSIIKLISCYLQADDSKVVSDIQPNLLNFMNFAAKMMPITDYYNTGRSKTETILNYKIDEYKSLVRPNKNFFEASAIFMEYLFK